MRNFIRMVKANKIKVIAFLIACTVAGLVAFILVLSDVISVSEAERESYSSSFGLALSIGATVMFAPIIIWFLWIFMWRKNLARYCEQAPQVADAARSVYNDSMSRHEREQRHKEQVRKGEVELQNIDGQMVDIHGKVYEQASNGKWVAKD